MRWLILASLMAIIPADSPPCEGEFTRDAAGVCTMLLPSSAGGAAAGCKAGQYLCPSDQLTCVASASEYTSCPNLKGTHLCDPQPPSANNRHSPPLTGGGGGGGWGVTRGWTPGIGGRLDYLLAPPNPTPQIAQLQNSPP
eukprot:COSAG04_NODE_1539_length_6420_cov_9.834045_1_plen_139_part_10